MSKWIRKEDQVVIIAGNEKGKTGTVLGRSDKRVVVQGINLRKKHVKRTQKTQTAQIIDIEAPLNISNVMPSDKNGKPVKLKVRQKGKAKDLIYLDNGKEVVYRTIKK